MKSYLIELRTSHRYVKRGTVSAKDEDDAYAKAKRQCLVSPYTSRKYVRITPQ